MCSASEKAAAVSAVRNDFKQGGCEQASKKTLKLNTPVSSLLQVCPSLTF
jgi:hypothetical protein